MVIVVAPDTRAEYDQADSASITAKPVIIQLDGSYPSGGYPFTPSVYGFAQKVVAVVLSAGAASTGRTGGFQIASDDLSNRLRVFTLTATSWTEAAVGSNLSSIRLRCLVFGY